MVGLFEDDVDHPGDGVRAVLGRGAVTQDLDMIDQRGGDHVEVDRLRAGVQRRAVVEQGAVVAALAVDQHQHLVAVQAAQADGPHHRRGTVAGRCRQVDGRQHAVQGAGQVRLAGGQQLLGRDHVHRRGAFGQGAGLATVADHHDGVQRVVALALGGQQRACGRRGFAHGEKQQAAGEDLARLG